MPYSDHFRLTDDLIAHLDGVLIAINDPFLESRYTGFLAVSSVTVLELAMKTIFTEFSADKHKVLGNFCSAYFDRINGRIMLKEISGTYVPTFGLKYQRRFQKNIDAREKAALQGGTSIKSSYGNLITWRNSFAHEGNMPANASYAEVKRSYQCGKEIMDALAQCMRR